MFDDIVGFLIFLGLGVVAACAYHFLGDWWDIKQAERTKLNSLNKIAQVKLVSDDKKDIAQFITLNAPFLSISMVKQLVSRIELLKADDVINNDDNLKQRIDDLSNEEEDNPHPAKSQVCN